MQEVTHMFLDDQILDSFHGKLWRLRHQFWKHAEHKHRLRSEKKFNNNFTIAYLLRLMPTIIVWQPDNTELMD